MRGRWDRGRLGPVAASHVGVAAQSYPCAASLSNSMTQRSEEADPSIGGALLPWHPFFALLRLSAANAPRHFISEARLDSITAIASNGHLMAVRGKRIRPTWFSARSLQGVLLDSCETLPNLLALRSGRQW